MNTLNRVNYQALATATHIVSLPLVNGEEISLYKSAVKAAYPLLVEMKWDGKVYAFETVRDVTKFLSGIYDAANN